MNTNLAILNTRPRCMTTCRRPPISGKPHIVLSIEGRWYVKFVPSSFSRNTAETRRLQRAMLFVKQWNKLQGRIAE